MPGLSGGWSWSWSGTTTTTRGRRPAPGIPARYGPDLKGGRKEEEKFSLHSVFVFLAAAGTPPTAALQHSSLLFPRVRIFVFCHSVQYSPAHSTVQYTVLDRESSSLGRETVVSGYPRTGSTPSTILKEVVAGVFRGVYQRAVCPL